VSTETRTVAKARRRLFVLAILVLAVAVTPILATKLDDNANLQVAADATEKFGNQSVQMDRAPSSVTIGSVTVHVIDNSSGLGIASANVTLQYPVSSVEYTIIPALTNPNGYVSFTLFQICNPVPENSCYITAMKSGYYAQRISLTLSPTNETRVTISLVSLFPSTSDGIGIVLLAIALPVFLVIAPLLVVDRRRRDSASGNVSPTREVVDLSNEERGRTNALYPENYEVDVHLRSETMISKGAQMPDASLGTCMICHMKFEQGDIGVRCPYCGSMAHKTHMLEWLHVENYCPVCGAHINEHDLE
jgi:5-hydroxyisourate hydrolase-like protein (transthyretin family)